MNIEKIHAQFSSNMSECVRSELVFESLTSLTQHHYESCGEYKMLLDSFGYDARKIQSLSDLPFLPVTIFKQFDLLSVGLDQVFKVVHSSGTSGSNLSKIYLDRNTAVAQSKALSKILTLWLGSRRLPMLIVDARSSLEERSALSARSAGILGFSAFGRNHTFALKDDMSLDFDALLSFSRKYKTSTALLFGFTSFVWQEFVTNILASGFDFKVPKGILFHGGGWKRLEDKQVTPDQFKRGILQSTGIRRVHNYYGMAEQIGSIAVECAHGYLHATCYGDILVRDPFTLNLKPDGEPGILQTFSVIPQSYPGHSLLTEDVGILMGRDGCKCGRAGPYFRILRRLEQSELKGCSDTRTIAG